MEKAQAPQGSTQSREPASALTGRAALAWVLLAAAVTLTYTLLTSQAWEDYYITFRHSANLVEGKGLTYQEGQRIQGFSSPLTTLLLAAAYAVGGSEPAALTLFRALSLGAFATGLWLLLGALRRSGAAVGWLALALPGLIYVLDAKAVAFSMNGMETGLLLGFLAGAWYCATLLPEHDPSTRSGQGPSTRSRQGLLLGICWAGMMWTRPDSFVYIGAMALAWALFAPARAALLRSLLRAAGLCAAAYLPWFAFAWIYYGSPVPHSISAKGLGLPASAGAWLAATTANVPQVWAYLYLPPYSEFSTWRLLALGGGLLAMAASFYWLWPGGGRFARAASLVTLCGVIYLALMPRIYPWYYPAVMLCSLPPVAALLTHLHGASRKPVLRVGTAIAALLLTAGLSWAWVDCTTTVRVVQRVSEDGNRVAIGRWLASHAGPGDRVYLECPGYIGYYSGLEMLDYPGLVSPPVVAARQRVTDDFAVVGQSVAPEWMVLRSEEVDHFRAVSGDWIRRHYRLARTFDVTDRLRREAPQHPGILYDGAFHVLQRIEGP